MCQECAGGQECSVVGGEKLLERHRAAETTVLNNSPQEVAVASLRGPALGDFLELSHLFSKSVASERLKLVPLKGVDESASEGQGRLFWGVRAG